MQSDTCPHCRLKVILTKATPAFQQNSVLGFVHAPHKIADTYVQALRCPSRPCQRVSLWIYQTGTDLSLLWPRTVLRSPPPAAVPKILSDAYVEAALLESDSAVACAIMARRCLEMTVKVLDFKGSNLEKRIDALAADPRASYKLKEQLHRLRHSGNYAVHGDLIGELAAYEVGPHEVEAAFDALDDLFEDFFVAPDKLAKRKALFEEKDANAKAALAAAKDG